MDRILTFRQEIDGHQGEARLTVNALVIAGWTGRDEEALERHIAELEALGVKRPASTPCFYRVAASLLSTEGSIQVAGPDTSGEAEAVLIGRPDGLWVGTGSDHTDRKTEAYNVTVSKQACAKPVAPVLWRYDDVADHWDELVLRSYAVGGGGRRLYQEGPVATMRTPEDLIARYGAGDGLPPGTVMFCGTLAVRGEIEAASRFEFELHDPVLGRTIAHGYDVEVLPVIG